jgi:aspartyl-tRNA(Asn)/glutamyl-tRNA(Gln) amidotransferase subunit A
MRLFHRLPHCYDISAAASKTTLQTERSLTGMAAVKDTHLHSTIQELSQAIRRRTVSPVELTRECLARIEKFNPLLNAFINVTADSALAQARTAEQEIQNGNWRGPVHGIPIGLKDLIDIAGGPTTAASALFKNRVPSQDADVVRRLKGAGAVLLGKHNLHEFAFGGSSVISYFGEVHNPWHVTRIAGGSSGGGAAAVAADLGYAAIGTDTGGSVREPAAFCGIVGLKPTYGRVSTRGVIPLSWSLDHVGPLTTKVADAALVLQAIAGYDSGEITSADIPVPDYLHSMRQSPKSLRVGLPQLYFFEDIDPEVARAVNDAVSVIRKLTSEVREVSTTVDNETKLLTAEAYAYHSEYVAKTPELYHPETLRRIRTGAKVSTPEYIQLRRAMKESRRSIAEVFKGVDLMVTPTVPIPPPTIATLKESPDDLRPRENLMLRNTRPINLWGLPAISLPCGFTVEGLPIGLQIIGPHWREDLVLQLAYAYEQATEWHNCCPDLSVSHAS